MDLNAAAMMNMMNQAMTIQSRIETIKEVHLMHLFKMSNCCNFES